jgi:hypothetical protein
MQRYFFVIRWPTEEHDDHSGTLLPNDDAAVSYAIRIIGELKVGGGYNEEGLTMIIRNASGIIIGSILFAGLN